MSTGTGSAATAAADPAAKAARATPRETASHRLTEPRAATADSASDYGKGFRGSTSYRNFILSALAAARDGDRDAQYYVHAALAYCDESYRFFFKRRGQVLSVDEAIAVRAELPGPSMTEAIKRAYSRCHEIYGVENADWGTAQEWLSKATSAGQPLAQMETAIVPRRVVYES